MLLFVVDDDEDAVVVEADGCCVDSFGSVVCDEAGSLVDCC